MTDVLRITPARQRVLEVLQLEDSTTAAALADRLSLTEAAVRQHLKALEADGLVVAAVSTPERPGRPAARWSLTDDGRSSFPDRHGDLAVQLVDAMRSTLGEDGLARVIEARADEQLRWYRELLAPAGTDLHDRVATLATQRTAEGYMADMIEDQGSYVLVEHHCPICDAARSCLGFCSAELRLFRDALGDDVTVERTEHLLADGVRCSYRITPR